MKSRYIAIVTLLMVGHLLSELHSVIYWVDPKTISYWVDDWFIKPKFRVDHISILWYSKMVEDSLLLVVFFFAGACQSHSHNYKTYLEWQRYAMRLYCIWLLYFFYHCVDTFLFFYNYKSNNLLYVVMLGITTVLAGFIGFYRVKIFLKE
jgi:hypothetical protein